MADHATHETDPEPPVLLDAGTSNDVPATAGAASLSRHRRQLREFKAEVSKTLAFLRARGEGRNAPISDFAWAAISEAALDLQCNLILDREDRRVHSACKAWREGRRPDLNAAAEENVELLLRTVHSALAALGRLDAVGYPAPPVWSNLPPAHLARAVNGFFEARTQQLAAWKDPE